MTNADVLNKHVIVCNRYDCRNTNADVLYKCVTVCDKCDCRVMNSAAQSEVVSVPAAPAVTDPALQNTYLSVTKALLINTRIDQ